MHRTLAKYGKELCKANPTEYLYYKYLYSVEV